VHRTADVDARAYPIATPGLVELSRTAARGGQLQTLVLFAILALMVVKPF
jgi:hypothetical protein